MRKKRKPRWTGLRLIAIIIIVVCGVVTLNRQELSKANSNTDAKIEELQDKIKDEKKEAKEIEEKKKYVQTLKYIEEVAREKLGLVYKDEIIFKSKD